MRAAWIDCAGAAFLPLSPRPELVVRDLGELADALGRPLSKAGDPG
jgi:hypothetical protein